MTGSSSDLPAWAHQPEFMARRARVLERLQAATEDAAKQGVQFDEHGSGDTWLAEQYRRWKNDLVEFLSKEVNPKEARSLEELAPSFGTMPLPDGWLHAECKTIHSFLMALSDVVLKTPEKVLSTPAKESDAVVYNPTPDVDRRKVFVIYGRNERLRESVFQLLRDGGLDPREWNKLVLETRNASPHNLEVVTKGLSTAVAVVALWSGDDLARLRPDLHGPGESLESERVQPRSNVILETGLALATKRENVVIVRVCSIRNASDLDGLNYVTIQDGDQKDTKGRKDLLDRLAAVGAAVDIEGKTDWMKAGSFKDDPVPAAGASAPAASVPRTTAPSVAVQVVEHEIMSSGFTGASTALKKIVLKNVTACDIWRVRLKVTYSRHGGTLASRAFALGDETTHPPILPKGATVTFLWTKRGRKGTRPPDARYLNYSTTEVSGKATKAHVDVEGFEEVRA